MRNAENDELCAVCEITTVHINRVARRATPFPPSIRKSAEELLGLSDRR
jgi:acyl-CoA thioesterase FadM